MKAIFYASFKNSPADFVVSEQLPFADTFTGTGEHLWLYVQKIGLNTQHLAQLLAQWATIPLRNVGFSGLKDRHAKTFQWFSLTVGKNKPDLASFDDFFAKHLPSNESVILLNHHYHQKKLNRGTHKANQFLIVLKDVKINHQSFSQSLNELAQGGFPNFFGKQRFGQDGHNLDKAYQLCAKAIQGKLKIRASDSLILSTARSHIFNEILTHRITNNAWQTPLDGDVFNLDGTGSLFTSTIDEIIIQRLKMGDIHPTAPLFGKGGKQASNQALALEQQILNRPDIRPLADGLQILATGQRRATRAIPKDLTHWFDGDDLTLKFTLPTGSFATSLLDYLVDDLNDGSLGKHFE